MTAPALPPVSGADGRPAWSWPINPDRYNRRPSLTILELEALRHLGMNLRRRRCYDRDAPEWHAIARLLRAAELETAYWAWTPQEWLRLIGTTVDEFESPWPGWIDGTVRPYVVAYGYLLCAFTDFDRLGLFNRLALA